MHRIDSTNAVVAPPATGAVGATVGYWQNGNPGTGTVGTVFDQDWGNAIQEELMAFLTGAGVASVKGTNSQALQSLKRLFGGNVATVVATGALTVDMAGRVLVDASGGNITLTLPAANALACLRYDFARIDSSANTVTIQRAGADDITNNFGATVTSFQLPFQFAARSITTTGGTRWYGHQPAPYLPGFQLFTASGNFTVGANVFFVDDEVIGGGSGAQGSTPGNAGNGGGGGGGSRKRCAVTPAQVVAVTIGAGSAGVAIGGTSSAGGTSSFGAFNSATGGVATSTGSPGIGGTGSGGDTNVRGGGGIVGTNATAGGMGGNAAFGGGTQSGGSGTGLAGNSPGGGGAGSGGGGTSNGGAGSDGWVLVSWGKI